MSNTRFEHAACALTFLTLCVAGSAACGDDATRDSVGAEKTTLTAPRPIDSAPPAPATGDPSAPPTTSSPTPDAPPADSPAPSATDPAPGTPPPVVAPAPPP